MRIKLGNRRRYACTDSENSIPGINGLQHLCTDGRCHAVAGTTRNFPRITRCITNKLDTLWIKIDFTDYDLRRDQYVALAQVFQRKDGSVNGSNAQHRP